MESPWTHTFYTFLDAMDVIYNDDDLMSEIMGEISAVKGRELLNAVEGTKQDQMLIITMVEEMIGQYVWAAEERGEIVITGKE